MLSLLCERLYRVGDRGSAGGYSQTGYAAFQSSDTILKYALCGVGQSAVNIACVSKTEAIGRML